MIFREVTGDSNHGYNTEKSNHQTHTKNHFLTLQIAKRILILVKPNGEWKNYCHEIVLKQLLGVSLKNF